MVISPKDLWEVWNINQCCIKFESDDVIKQGNLELIIEDKQKRNKHQQQPTTSYEQFEILIFKKVIDVDDVVAFSGDAFGASKSLAMVLLLVSTISLKPFFITYIII